MAKANLIPRTLVQFARITRRTMIVMAPSECARCQKHTNYMVELLYSPIPRMTAHLCSHCRKVLHQPMLEAQFTNGALIHAHNWTLLKDQEVWIPRTRGPHTQAKLERSLVIVDGRVCAQTQWENKETSTMQQKCVDVNELQRLNPDLPPLEINIDPQLSQWFVRAMARRFKQKIVFKPAGESRTLLEYHF